MNEIPVATANAAVTTISRVVQPFDLSADVSTFSLLSSTTEEANKKAIARAMAGGDSKRPIKRLTATQRRAPSSIVAVPLPYARSTEIRFQELVGLIPPLSYSLPRGPRNYSIHR